MKKGSLVLRLFLYASLVSLVWLGGYVGLTEMFSVEETAPETLPETVTPAVHLPTTVSSVWSVLAVTDEEKEVTAFLFRYADFLADTMVFIEVPTNTKAELAAGGYEVLSVHNPEVPELFMVSDLCRIFSEETWCTAAAEVGVSLLGVRPKECYILEESLYEQMTESVEGQVRFKIPVSVKDTITEAVEHAVTDDSLREELLYLESYLDMKNIRYVSLPGEASAEEYHPEFGEIQTLVERVQAGVHGTEEALERRTGEWSE